MVTMDNTFPDHASNELPLNAGLMTLLAVFVSLLVGVDYWRGATFTNNLMVIGWFLTIINLSVLSHYKKRFDPPSYHIWYVVLYHLCLSGLLIFVVPYTSYYVFIWVILGFVSEFYYQKKGTMLSLLALAATLVAGEAYQTGHLNGHVLLNTLPIFLIIAFVNRILGMLTLGNRTERLYAAQKASRSEYEHSRLLALINSINDAVIATDQDGVITTYNASALALVDTHADLTGKNITDIINLAPVKGKILSLIEIAHDIERTQKRNDLLMIGDIEDSKPIALDVTISKISTQNPLAAMRGYTFLIRDITRQKSIDEERDLFISEVSHELRTPLTITEADVSLAGMQLDKKPLDKSAAKKAIDEAHKEVLFLSEMVNDLSTLSRAENADKDMEVSTFELKKLVDTVVKEFLPKAHEKKLYIKSDVSEDLPKLHTSVLYVQEILQNLISNAIKYTDKGGVKISCSEIDGSKLRIDVTDTGAGISVSEQPRVFEKFWRSEDALTRTTGGTGLGLYISAKLARRIRSDLTLTSKLQKGSTFSLVIPFVATQEVDKKNLARDETAHLFE